MKILALRGENLASIQHRFEIDFAQGAIAQNGLFAITGKTGAGKSTLLDAICLALYDRMPRLQSNKKNDAEIGLGDTANKVKANDVRSILSRGKAECFAEVDFLANDGSTWRAHWTVSRARAKGSTVGRIKAQDQWLENLDTKQRIAGKKTEVLPAIEKLIGLSYEQFRRAVMLPQGDFAAFLKASSDERAILLERMTGGEIYTRLSVAAYEKSKKERAELDGLQSKLGDIEILPEEEKQKITAKLEIEKNELTKLKQKQESLTKHLTSLNKQQELSLAVDEAKLYQQNAITAVEEAKDRIQTFDLVEKVQAARSDFTLKEQNKELIEQLAAKLENQNIELNELSQNILEATNSVDLAQDALKKQESIWQEAEPKIRQAAKQDTQINGLNEQWKKQNDQLVELSKKLNDSKQSLEKHQQQKASLENKQKEISANLAEKNNLTVIAEQFKSVQDNLEQYNELDKSIKQHNKLIEDIQIQLAKIEKTLTQNAKNKEDLLKEKAEQETRLKNADKQGLKQQELENIKKAEELQNYQETLNELFNFSSDWIDGLKTRDTYSTDLADQRKKITEHQKEIDKINPMLLSVESKLEEATRQLKQSNAIANLSHHRASLVENDPCPLCGSLDHPFALKNPVADSLITSQEQRQKELQTQKQELVSTLVSLQERLKDAEKNSQTIENKLTTFQTENTQLKEKFAEFLTKSEFDFLSVLCLGLEDFILWRDKQRESYKINSESQKELNGSLATIKTSLEQIDLLQQELTEKEQRISELQTMTHQNEQQKTSLAEKLTHYQTQLGKDQEKLASRQQILSTFFGQDSWITLLEEQGDELFLQQLKMDVETLVTQQDLLKQIDQQIQDLNPQILAKENDCQNYQNQVQDAEKDLAGLGENLKSLQEQRLAVLDKLDLEQYENELKTLFTNAQQNKTNCEKQLTELTKQQASMQAAVKSTQEQQLQANDKEKVLLDKWLTWQEKFQFSEERLIELLSYDELWRKAESEALNALQDAIKQAKTLINERQKRFDEHQEEFQIAQVWLKEHKAQTAEEINLLTEELITHQTQKDEIIYAIRQRLDASEQAKKQAGSLTQEIEKKQKQAEVWLQISDLIGSASGNKFRNLAQSLTLQQLVLEANQHLHELSPRYALQTVPTSPLALQVIDHDMGDEVRSVESLSGGESFLVSLSLALALASLAADTRKLGSLFIDEGFGTLDPDSLEMTIACLDSLQADGRQIGVISHVSSLVERIGTQIVVEAQGGGVSRVKIS